MICVSTDRHWSHLYSDSFIALFLHQLHLIHLRLLLAIAFYFSLPSIHFLTKNGTRSPPRRRSPPRNYRGRSPPRRRYSICDKDQKLIVIRNEGLQEGVVHLGDAAQGLLLVLVQEAQNAVALPALPDQRAPLGAPTRVPLGMCTKLSRKVNK